MEKVWSSNRDKDYIEGTEIVKYEYERGVTSPLYTCRTAGMETVYVHMHVRIEFMALIETMICVSIKCSASFILGGSVLFFICSYCYSPVLGVTRYSNDITVLGNEVK